MAEAMIDFGALPEIGTVLRLDDQPYELRAVAPHVRIDGRRTFVLSWETTCPDCGAKFEITTGLKAQDLRRRCERCQRPHKPVIGKRGRKVQVTIAEP